MNVEVLLEGVLQAEMLCEYTEVVVVIEPGIGIDPVGFDFEFEVELASEFEFGVELVAR